MRQYHHHLLFKVVHDRIDHLLIRRTPQALVHPHRSMGGIRKFVNRGDFNFSHLVHTLFVLLLLLLLFGNIGNKGNEVRNVNLFISGPK